MKTIKTLLLSIGLIFSMFAAPMYATATVGAQAAKDAICEGVPVEGGASCDGDSAGLQISGVITAAIRILQTIVGLIALFTLIIAGLTYITSGGDSGKTKSAKDRILYAVIGLVVVALAEVIVQFVLNRITP